MADDELIRRAQVGDREAFEKLVKAHFRAAYNFAYKLAGNAEDASDITQDSFIQAHHALPSFRGDANFTTWLYRIVTSVFLERRRSL